MLGELITLLLEWFWDDDDSNLRMDYDRCRRCTADLSRDLSKQQKHCRKCGKRISRSQRMKWRRSNPGHISN